MSQNQIKNNMFVILTYEIYEGSEIIEQVDNPVTLIHGQGKKLLPKIEEALIGKKPGDVIEVDINPNDGFGECSCKWHICNVQPKLDKGIKPFKTCRHLKAVKGYRLKLQNRPDLFQ